MKRHNNILLTVLVMFVFFGFNSCSFLAIGMLADNLNESESDTTNSNDQNQNDINENNDIEDLEEDNINYQVIQIPDATFTLVWDTDDDTITVYKLYYKVLGSDDLQTLEVIEGASGSEISTEIDSGLFTKNEYIVLGVAAVDDEGNTSDIHLSTDITAIPTEGWVLEVI